MPDADGLASVRGPFWCPLLHTLHLPAPFDSDEFADPFTNAVAMTVMRLRRKLGDPPLIETVIGSGYRLL
jgi:DNA-binding response OmpR family regulator